MKNSVTLRLGVEGDEQVLAALRKIGQSGSEEFKKLPKEARDASRAFDTLERSLDPAAKSAHAFAKAYVDAQRAVQTGARSQEEAARVIDLATERHRRLTRELGENAKATGLARHEWTNLGRQLTDVGTSLAGGASPFMVLTQQGGQIADVFSSSKNGAGAAIKDFGGAVLRFALNPATLLAAAAGASALAMLRWKEQTDALTVSLNGLGRQSGLTLSQVEALAANAGASSGISGGAARGLAGQYLSAGVPRAALGGAIGATQDFSRRLGVPFEDAAKQIGEALADPVRGAEELARKFGIVTFAEREQIKELAALGDRSGASAKLLGILTARIAEMADPTWQITKLFDRLKNTIADSVDNYGSSLENSAAALGRFLKNPLDYTFGDAEDRRIAQRKSDEAARRIAEDQRASALEKQARDDEAAARNQELARLREDGAFAVREIQARTLAEREAVAMERARVETLRATNDAVKASIAAENERAKLVAEAARKAQEYARSGADQLALSQLSPYERGRQQILNEARDLREQIGLRGAAGFARGAGHAPYADIIAAEGTAKHGNPYDTSLGYLASPRPLTQMSMAESLAWGDIVRRRMGMNSSAKGAFQIVNSTQREAMRALGLGMNDPFSEENQRAMADWIYQKQGLGAWEGFKRRGGAGVAVNDNGAGGIAANIDRGLSDWLKAYDQEQITRPLRDANEEIERQRAALGAQAKAFGKSTEETARAAKKQELLNKYVSQGVPITDQLRASISATAENFGRYTQEAEDAAEAQKRLVEEFDLVRSSAREALGGMASALLDGKNAGDALNDSLKRIGDRLINLAADRAIEGIFGKMGSGNLGGGFLGSLFGSFFKGPFGLPQFPFAHGGVMTPGGPLPLRAYASGGVAYGPQLALFGEGRRPEAYVPLPDGRTIPVSLSAPAAAAPSQGGGSMQVNIIGAPAGTQRRESVDARGNRRLDVIIDERVASGLASPAGRQAMAGFGARPQLSDF